MPVRINRPPVNIREKLSELERPIGLNGSALMRTETPQEAFSLIGAGRKNILINGAFEVAQRGTTFTNVYEYTLDRWQVTRYAGQVNIVTQQNTGGITDDPGLIKCIRHEFSTGGAGSSFLNQPIESSTSKKYRGKWLTLSFWARTDSTHSGKLFYSSISHHNNPSYNDDGMYYFNFKNASTTENWYTYTPTTTWKRFQQTLYIPTNIEQIGIGLIQQNLTNGYIEFTGVQLEEGKVATPFEHRSYAEELALCQRYYYRSLTTRQALLYKGPLWETNYFYFPVEMRTEPSISGANWFLRNTGVDTNIEYTGFSYNQTRSGFFITSTTSNTNVFQCWFADAPLRFDAEL